jgi:hypothetical protein
MSSWAGVDVTLGRLERQCQKGVADIALYTEFSEQKDG